MSYILLFFLISGIRPFEPVLLNGNQLAAFQAQPVAQLFCASYDGNVWHVVPFQIDERAPDDSFFMPDDGLFDANDEWVLDPADGGKIALVTHFGGFTGVENYRRVQVKMTDPISGDAVYLYLFQSLTPPVLSPEYRMTFSSALDEISCEHYMVGFDDVSRQRDELMVWEGTQWSPDLLDREKMRVAGTILGFPYGLDETSFVFEGLSSVEGPLRVLRQVRGSMSVFGQSFDATTEQHYYNGMLAAPGGTLANDPSLGIERVRLSIDWSSDFTGAILNAPYILDIDIDGQPDALGPVSYSQDDLDALWFQYTRDNWSIIQVGRYKGVAAINQLYYRDDLNGGTSDGTADTGDLMSYGDTGLIFEQLSTTESSVDSRIFIDNTGVLDGLTARERFLIPLILELTEQNSTDGLAQLYELWHLPNPEDPARLISIRDMIDYQGP